METSQDQRGMPQMCGGLSCRREAQVALTLLASRWAFPVLESVYLESGPSRFGSLQRRIGEISNKELAKQLREFLDAGLIRRQAFARRPVRYEITQAGSELLRQAQGLIEWGRAALAPERSPATWLDPLLPAA